MSSLVDYLANRELHFFWLKYKEMYHLVWFDGIREEYYKRTICQRRLNMDKYPYRKNLSKDKPGGRRLCFSCERMVKDELSVTRPTRQ